MTAKLWTTRTGRGHGMSCPWCCSLVCEDQSNDLVIEALQRLGATMMPDLFRYCKPLLSPWRGRRPFYGQMRALLKVCGIYNGLSAT